MIIDVLFSCRLNPFRPFLQTIPLLTFPAILPDNTLGSEFAITAWVGTGLAIVKTCPAITDLHLLAGYISLTV
jgi:hypothetical protein